jgi:sterol desaturase/sphingolipid hydroxylase (fatty acid hydroxylase superfamily)
MLNNIIDLYSSLATIYLHWLKFIEQSQAPALIGITLLVFILLEMILLRPNQSRVMMVNSYISNISLFTFNNVTVSLLSITSLLVLAEKFQVNGLISDFPLPTQLVLTFLLMDLMNYAWHWLNHHYDFFWRFHKVHHSDLVMNASTAFRVHFVEIIFTFLLKAMLIMVTGIDFLALAFCESISTLFVMFHHLNIRSRSEKYLQWLIIVPSMHRIHHAQQRNLHDSNYGAVFSFWDRMLGTLKDNINEVEIGLKNVKEMHLFQLLKFGFISQSLTKLSLTIYPHLIPRMIAEAAYYLAEKRGFAPGNELKDWLEAEQFIYAIYNQQLTDLKQQETGKLNAKLKKLLACLYTAPPLFRYSIG